MILFDINCRAVFFLELSPRVMDINTQKRNVNLKALYSKETVDKIKRQLTDWEETNGVLLPHQVIEA